MNVSSDTLSRLRIRRWSKRKHVWNHTSSGSTKLSSTSSKDEGGDEDLNLSSSGSSQPSTPTSLRGRTAPYPPTSLQVLTWNIDFMQPNGYPRTCTALDHIQRDIFDCKDGEEPPPCVLLLQEIHPESLPAILEHPWVRDCFLVVPVKVTAWPSPRYGNVTLVSRTIPVVAAQMLTFWNSVMGRHAVVVDLRVNVDGEGDAPAQEVTLRVANVHLESLPYGAAMRPVQLSSTAELLRAEGIHAGVVCGDMNAIGPGDRDIHRDAGLVDAWTGDDEDEEGFTWGYQPASEFPAGRLDKILYTSEERCLVEKPRRVGVGLKTADGQWATDHYGLVVRVRMIG